MLFCALPTIWRSYCAIRDDLVFSGFPGLLCDYHSAGPYVTRFKTSYSDKSRMALVKGWAASARSLS